MNIRNARSNDAVNINNVMEEWWGRKYEDFTFSKAFLTHFSETCLIYEKEHMMKGFLIGFRSQSCPTMAYIRFVLVNPKERNKGIGHSLYSHFFNIVKNMGCEMIESVTSPKNKGSINFHVDLGFDILEQDKQIDGYYICHDYHGRPNTDRIVFRKDLYQIRKNLRE